MCLDLRDELLLEGRHVVLGQHDCGDLRLARQLKLDVLLQVVQALLVAFDEDKVEALLRQEAGVDATRLGASTKDNCCISLVCTFDLRVEIFCRVALRLEVSHDRSTSTHHSASEVVSGCAEPEVENTTEDEAGVVHRKLVVDARDDEVPGPAIEAGEVELGEAAHHAVHRLCHKLDGMRKNYIFLGCTTGDLN